MMLRRFFVLLLPMLLVVGVAQARQAPLVIPDPIPVPQNLDTKQVVRAIKLAMTARTWLIASEAPGRIEAGITVRSHSARIVVEYDATQIRIQHVDSSELQEDVDREGVHVIHRNYNSWLQNLAQDIRLQLQAAQI